MTQHVKQRMDVVDISLPPRGRPHVVAMIHVHSTTAILNHEYTALLGVTPPSREELVAIETIITELDDILRNVQEPLIQQVVPLSRLRSLAFIQTNAIGAITRFEELPFVKVLIERALREVNIYVSQGIQCVEVENVGAPYFLGSGVCPWEELLTIFVVVKAIRAEFATLAIGAHILSCNELEALPIAMTFGCFFVRCEASLFEGLRPEGRTDNKSNLARFFYVRNILRTKLFSSARTHSGRNSSCFPMLWSDVKKKHTVFSGELDAIETWLHNITFAKLEAVIVTGAETGSDVDENSLKTTRDAVDKVKSWNSSQFAANDLPMLPVVTGSGLNFDMYSKYADFMIIGTAFKKGKYWENEVDEHEVQRVMKLINNL